MYGETGGSGESLWKEWYKWTAMDRVRASIHHRATTVVTAVVTTVVCRNALLLPKQLL